MQGQNVLEVSSRMESDPREEGTRYVIRTLRSGLRNRDYGAGLCRLPDARSGALDRGGRDRSSRDGNCDRCQKYAPKRSSELAGLNGRKTDLPACFPSKGPDRG